MSVLKFRAGKGKGEITRRRIARQAAPLFNQHGYAGTSMSGLMAATRLGKGGLYRHFKSKELLAAAAFDYAWETVSATRLHGIERCNSSLEKLLLLVDNFVSMPGTVPGGCPLLNTAIDSDDGSLILRKKARSALTGWRSFLVDLLRAGQAEGDLRPELDPYSIATVLIATLEGAIMMCRLEKCRDPLHAVGAHLEQYLSSLQVKRP
jgi:TetR/AcrR family transcriptional repressor of nem operon